MTIHHILPAISAMGAFALLLSSPLPAQDTKRLGVDAPYDFYHYYIDDWLSEHGAAALKSSDSQVRATAESEKAAWEAYAEASQAFYKNHVIAEGWADWHRIRLIETRLEIVKLGPPARSLDAANALLDDVYARICDRLAPEAKKSLQNAQAKWIVYRDVNAALASVGDGRAASNDDSVSGADAPGNPAFIWNTYERSLDLLALQCVFDPEKKEALAKPRHTFDIRFTDEDFSFEQTIADVGRALVDNDPKVRKEFDSLIGGAYDGRFRFDDATLLRMAGQSYYSFQRTPAPTEPPLLAVKGTYFWIHPMIQGHRGGYSYTKNIIFHFEAKNNTTMRMENENIPFDHADVSVEFLGFVDLKPQPVGK